MSVGLCVRVGLSLIPTAVRSSMPVYVTSAASLASLLLVYVLTRNGLDHLTYNNNNKKN